MVSTGNSSLNKEDCCSQKLLELGMGSKVIRECLGVFGGQRIDRRLVASLGEETPSQMKPATLDREVMVLTLARLAPATE